MNGADFLHVYPDLFTASVKTEEELESKDNGVLLSRRHITFSDLTLKMALAMELEFKIVSSTRNRLLIEHVLYDLQIENASKIIHSFIRILNKLDQLPLGMRDGAKIKKLWPDNDRTRVVVAVWEKYRKVLAENKLITAGDVLAEFIKDGLLYKNINMEGANALRFEGFDNLSPLELETIAHIAGEIPAELVLKIPQRREHLYGHILAQEQYFKKHTKSLKLNIVFEPLPLEGDEVRALYAKQLFADSKANYDEFANDERIKLYRPVDENLQMQFALNAVEELLSAGVKPQDIGIAVSNVEEIRQDLRGGIVKRNLPIAYNRSVSIFAARCFNWIHILRNILESEMSVTKVRILHEEMDSFGILPAFINRQHVTSIEAVLERIGVNKLSQNWSTAVEKWSEENKEEELGLSDWLLQWTDWLNTWKVKATKSQWLEKLSEIIQAIELPKFYSQHEARHFTHSYQALKIMQSIVSEINNVDLSGDVEIDGGDFFCWFVSSLNTQIKQRSSPEPETVSVLNFEEAAKRKFKHLFLLNMYEGSFPVLPNKDSLLKERETVEINKKSGVKIFETTGDSYKRQLATFMDILLSSECINMYSPVKKGGEIKNSSLFFEEIAKVYECEDDPEIFNLANTFEEWLLKVVKFLRADQIQQNMQELPVEVVNKIKDIINRIEHETLRAEFMRLVDDTKRKDTGNEYCGELSEEWLKQTGYNLSNILSQTWFEEYMQCPFKFYLNRILEVESFEEIEADPNNIQTGSALHNVLERLFVKDKLADMEDGEKAAQLAAEYMKEELKRQSESGEEITSAIIPYNARAWSVWVKKMMKVEQDNLKQKTPIMFEKTFGEDDSDDLTGKINISRKQDEPVYIRGRIDRIDKGEQSQSVIDYKSGSSDTTYKNKINKEFGVSSFQMPLYILGLMEAVQRKQLEELPKTIEARYVLVKKIKSKTSKEYNLEDEKTREYFSLDPEVRIKKNPMQNLANHLEEIYQKISKGEFEISPRNSKDSCKYCPYPHICRYDGTKIEFEKMEAEV